MNPLGVSEIEGFLGKERHLGKALYPGTFDPITYGHLDIVERAVGIFGEVIVIVADSMKKKPLFSLEERVEMARKATKDIRNVQVDSLRSPLLVEEARMRGVKVVIRGLRAVSDYEYELQMALTNRRIAPEINTIFMISSSEYTFLSSTIVKEVAELGADVSGFVPPCVEKMLRGKFQGKTIKLGDTMLR